MEFDEMRKPNYSLADKTAMLEKLHAHFNKENISLKELNEFVDKNKIKQFPYFILRECKVARNTFNIVSKNVTATNPVVQQQSMSAVAMAPVAQVVNLASRRAQNVTESFVPQKNSTYVPFGFYNDLRNIIKSRIFYPIYITGLSGNGKTMMIEQVCAALGRELVRVNITKRTDESDLIGSYELIDGSTVRREGPVLTAMRRGAVLLLDECDLGTEDILCLQPILEGKPYFDKKTGEVVHPAAGFTVLATANTKGKGSDDGRFIGTNILNEAFLERFAVTVEQEYPPANTERKILEKNFAELGINDDVFIERLITWAEVIRKSFNDGAVDEVISTRRLVHISKAFSIFNNRLKAIEMCLNRFDTDTKTAFLDLYTKVDAEATAPVASSDILDGVKVTTSREISTDDLIVTVSLDGNNRETRLSVSEIEDFRNQGLTLEQIVDRTAKTLARVLDRDIPF
jgi:MoxR-like ATPase